MKFREGLKKHGPVGLIIFVASLFFIVLFFGMLDEKERPDFLRSNEKLMEEKYNKRKEYYAAAAKFYEKENINKSLLYIDSIARMDRELDSICIFVIKRNKL